MQLLTTLAVNVHTQINAAFDLDKRMTEDNARKRQEELKTGLVMDVRPLPSFVWLRIR